MWCLTEMDGARFQEERRDSPGRRFDKRNEDGVCERHLSFIASQPAACFWSPLERGRGQNRGVGYDEHDRRYEQTVEGSRIVG